MPETAVNHAPTTDKLGFTSPSRACIVEVAADKDAIIEALAEHGYLLALEHGTLWDHEFTMVSATARARVLTKLIDEVKSKMGYRPPAKDEK